MNTETRYLLAMTCIIPAIVGGYLYQKMKPSYHWLIYIMVLDAIMETIDFIGIKYPAFSPIANCCSNLYMFAQLALFLMFIQRNGYLQQRLRQILLAVAVVVAGYNFYGEGPPHKAFYYSLLCFGYAVQLFVATDILSKQVTVVNTKLRHNFWFWASCLFVLQNAYGLLVFTIYYFGLLKTPGGKVIGELNLFINVMYYCLFAIALVLVPKRNNQLDIKYFSA
jgi:hypothetical protein